MKQFIQTFIGCAVLAFVALFSGAALAQQATWADGDTAVQVMWLDHSTVVQSLASEYAETPTALGTAFGNVIELFEAKNGKTWTIVLTMPSGMTRIIVAGENWTARGPPTGDGI